MKVLGVSHNLTADVDEQTTNSRWFKMAMAQSQLTTQARRQHPFFLPSLALWRSLMFSLSLSLSLCLSLSLSVSLCLSLSLSLSLSLCLSVSLSVSLCLSLSLSVSLSLSLSLTSDLSLLVLFSSLYRLPQSGSVSGTPALSNTFQKVQSHIWNHSVPQVAVSAVRQMAHNKNTACVASCS